LHKKDEKDSLLDSKVFVDNLKQHLEERATKI